MLLRVPMADVDYEDLVPEERDARFWVSKEKRRDGKDRFQIIDEFVASLQNFFDTRQSRLVEYLKAYGLSYDDYGQASQRPNDDELKFNVVEPIVDTAVNKVCKSRVVPMALTTGGTYQERQRAKKFNRFISGLFMEAGVFDRDYQWTTDAFIGDSGIAKVIERDERVLVERCDPCRVYWDPEEAMLTGEVSIIVEDHFIDRYRLIEMLREWDEAGKLDCPLDDAIRAALMAKHGGDDGRYFRRPNMHDVVLIREAWHAKSSAKAKDGRHVIILKGLKDLVVEDYNSTEVPHIFLTRKIPLYGITSPGLMSAVLPGQREHDTVTAKLREAHRALGVSRIAYRKGGAVSPGELDDVPGTMLACEDPVGDIRELNMQPAHPDVYTYRSGLVADMQLTSGVPEMSMSGKPPEGVTAAKALGMLDDVVAEKLSQPLRCRERFFVKIAERALEKVGEIAARHRGKYTVRSETGKALEQINFKDVKVPFGSYRFKCFPTNFLSQTPSVRYQRLSEMHAAGEITELEFRALSEIPDLESDNDLETAPQDVVDMCIDAIMTKGRTFVTEGFDDHALIVQRGMKAYNLARVEAPDEFEEPDKYREHTARLKALANYINSAVTWMKPPPPSPNAAAGGQVPPQQPMDTGPMGMMPPPGMPPPGMPPGAGPPTNAFGPPMAGVVSNGMA